MSDTKTGTLREAIGRALDDTAAGLWMGQHGPGWGAIAADAVLALPELAAVIADADNWRRVTTGDPTEPEPLAMQARELLVRNRELEADREQYARQRAAVELRAAAGALTDRVRTWVLNALHDRADALDGEPQP